MPSLKHCDVCQKLARKSSDARLRKMKPTGASDVARYRVTFGIYAGGWYVCDAHLQPLLEEEVPHCVVKGGMRCSIDELIPTADDPSYCIDRHIATIRPRKDG